MFSSGAAVSFPLLNFSNCTWDSFDLAWSTAPMCGVVLHPLAFWIGWRLRPSALLAMLD